MKKYIYVFAVACMIFTSACNSKKESKEEKPSQDSIAQKSTEEEPALAVKNSVGGYGKEITADNAIDIKTLLEKKDADGFDGKISGVVTSSCQNRGCWMKLDCGDGKSMMVRTNEIFLVPKDIAGKQVIVAGKVSIETVSVDEQKHLAMDGGKSQAEIDAITDPKTEYTLNAEGVLIQ